MSTYIDEFCYAYKWTVEQVTSHPLLQLKRLFIAIVRRKLEEQVFAALARGADKQVITKLQKENDLIIEGMKEKVRGEKLKKQVANAGPSIEDQMLAANQAARSIGDPSMFRIVDGNAPKKNQNNPKKRKKKGKRKRRG